MLLADPLTSQLLRDPVLDLAFFQICNPALLYAVDHAKSFGQTALAIPRQHSALWEQHLKCLKNELNPPVFFDRQQADNFRPSSDDDGNDSSSGRIHNGIAFPSVYGDHLRLPTVISIWRTLASRSLSLSFESFLSS